MQKAFFAISPKALIVAVFAAMLFSYTPKTLSAQSIDVFRHFAANVEGDGVRLTWAVVMGAECNDIVVEHAAGDSIFEPVHRYPGICGSNSEEKQYSWLHPDPEPLVPNSYRLTHRFGDESEVVTLNVLFLPKGQTHSAHPNPANESATFVWQSNGQDATTLRLFSLSGKLITEIPDLRQGQYDLNTQTLPPGAYIYHLSGGGQAPQSGRLLVVH